MPKNFSKDEAAEIRDWKCCGCGMAVPDLVKRCDCATQCAYTGKSPVGYNASRLMKDAPDIELQKALDRIDYFGAGRDEGTMPNHRDFDELLRHAVLLRRRLE